MKNKKFKWIISIVLILVISIVAFRGISRRAALRANAGAINSETEYTVKRDDISISVSQSASVYPSDKRIIKSEIDGIVDGIFVTEGDVVEKGQILISLKSDSSNNNYTQINDIKLNIEKAQRELNDLYESQGALNIYATISGVISDLNIKAGDKISNNFKVASILDVNNAYIEVYFTKDSYNNISVGDQATVFMTKYLEYEDGTVVEKNSIPVQMGGGIFGYKVTIKMVNPGGYSIGDLAQITVENSNGSFMGMENGKIIDVNSESITAKVNGKVKSVHTENGRYINKGDLIATIEGDDLAFQIAEKQNLIKKYQNQIDDLTEGDIIYSPMNGTILQIDVAEEEVVGRASSLLTIADLNKMEVVLPVDELDITKIKLGQKASITSEVFKDENFSGKVSKISFEGKNLNGVTTYDVTIQLDDRKSLMSGMNVDVEIIADERNNVLVIPIDAVHKLEGDYIVTVKDSSGNYNDIKVELGLVTKDKVEILSGLKEGDIVVYKKVQNVESEFPRDGMRAPVRGGGNR